MKKALMLTARRKQILDLLVQGYDDQSMATNLKIGLHTVKYHLGFMYKRRRFTQGRKRVRLANWWQKRSAITAEQRRPPSSCLSSRQITVARIIAEGNPDKIASRLLRISRYTLRRHLTNIFAAVGCWNRVELAMYVARHRAVFEPPTG